MYAFVNIIAFNYKTQLIISKEKDQQDFELKEQLQVINPKKFHFLISILSLNFKTYILVLQLSNSFILVIDTLFFRGFQNKNKTNFVDAEFLLLKKKHLGTRVRNCKYIYKACTKKEKSFCCSSQYGFEVISNLRICIRKLSLYL